MRAINKILSSLIIIAILLGICSCGDGGDEPRYVEPDREYDEAEVLSAAAELMEKSKAINELYFGRGLEYDEKYSNGIYSKATENSLLSFGISSVAELKTKTFEVFSQNLAQRMIDTVLSSVKHENQTKYARYYDYDDNGTKVVMVNRNYEYYLKGSSEYHDDIRVKDVEGKEIIIALTVTVVSESGKTKTMEIEVRMLEEEDGWRFSSASDAVYNDNTDIYEDLEDELDKLFPS